MADSNKTVYILDSYGLIYRCYFAFISRPLTNSEGKNISALFGFFRNLHYIFKHYNPKYIFAAMDSTTKTFRHEKYPEYKASAAQSSAFSLKANASALSAPNSVLTSSIPSSTSAVSFLNLTSRDSVGCKYWCKFAAEM